MTSLVNVIQQRIEISLRQPLLSEDNMSIIARKKKEKEEINFFYHLFVLCHILVHMFKCRRIKERKRKRKGKNLVIDY
jgi:hypothetical protein